MYGQGYSNRTEDKLVKLKTFFCYFCTYYYYSGRPNAYEPNHMKYVFGSHVDSKCPHFVCLFVFEVLQPCQPNGVMSSRVSLPITTKEYCWPCGGQTYNRLITSQTHIQLSHWGWHKCPDGPVIATDKALFSSEICWYFSYFSTKTYVVGTH